VVSDGQLVGGKTSYVDFEEKKEIQPNLEQDKRLVQHSQNTNKDVLLIQPDINVQRSTKK